MPDPADIRDAENWNGGFYELAIEVGRTDDAQLGRVLDSVWRHAGIEGCFRRLPLPPEAVPLAPESLERCGHLNGIVRLPSGSRLVCGVCAVGGEDVPDWLDFYLPMAALSITDPRVGGFPFGDDGGPQSLSWRRPIDDWLVDVAQRVYSDVAYRLALVGFETSGKTYAEVLERGVPDIREEAYVLPDEAGSLRVYAANR
jgi:hypothetical protein